MAQDTSETTARDFIRRWEDSGAAERANHTMFFFGLTPVGKTGKSKKVEKLAWPKSLAEQAQAARAALGAEASPATAAELSRRFKGAKADRTGELLATLTALGQARSVGRWRAVCGVER